MATTQRRNTGRWLRPVQVGVFTLALCHGCTCDEDEPTGPDVGNWDRFECSVAPSALDFGRVAAGESAELPLEVRTFANGGTIEVRPSQTCPFVSVLPAADTFLFDLTRTFQVAYLPEGEDVLDCSVEFGVTILSPSSDQALTCPSVPLAGSAIDAGMGWAPCGAPENVDHPWSGVTGLSSNEVYVAGDEGRVLRYAGDCTWEDFDAGENRADLTDIWVYGYGDGGTERTLWTVGNLANEGTLLNYTGSGWSVVDQSVFFTYGAVWGSGECDVYFAGMGVATDFPNAQRYDCEGLAQFQIDFGMSEVTGLSGTAPDDVWAVMRQPTFQVYRFDGSTWNLTTDPLVDQPLHDVWATASGHVWAVGEQGSIFHWTGSEWTDESRSIEGTFYGVWAAESGEVLAVGEAGVAWFFDGAEWVEQGTGTTEDLMDVWGASAAEMFVVGRNSVYRFVAGGER